VPLSNSRIEAAVDEERGLPSLLIEAHARRGSDRSPIRHSPLPRYMSSPTVESTVATRTPSHLVNEVSEVIRAFFDAMNRQDLKQMERITAHDPDSVHIGTDTGEIWRGWSHLHADTIEQFDRLDVYEATIRDLAVHVSAAGDVAWYSHLLDAEIRSSHGTQSWSGARFTGVSKKIDGHWQLTQTHVSLPESHDSGGS